MGTKNLAIRDEVYRKLADAKRPDESFSDVIERILEKKENLAPFWAALSDSEHLSLMESEAKRIRKEAEMRT